MITAHGLATGGIRDRNRVPHTSRRPARIDATPIQFDVIRPPFRIVRGTDAANNHPPIRPHASRTIVCAAVKSEPTQRCPLTILLGGKQS